MNIEDHTDQQTIASVAYLACRILSGRRIASLYDLASSREVDLNALLREGFLREFDEKLRDYVPGYASNSGIEFTSSTGQEVEVFINERTFIMHVRGSAAYYIGNVRGEMIYVYDHASSAHHKFRIARYLEEKTAGVTADRSADSTSD